MTQSGFADIISKKYNEKDYFQESKQPVENPSKELDYRKVSPVAFDALSSKIEVKAQALIEKGPQKLEERMERRKVYSAKVQLDLDTSIIEEGKALVKDIGLLKEKFQKLITQMKDKRPSITYDNCKEVLEKYQKAYENFAIEKRAIEGRYFDLETKVKARVAKDNLSQPLKKTVDTFAARYKIDAVQVLADLNATRSNTLEISNIPYDYETAITDAETVLPDFRYYFCYLCYLCSEKIGDTYANRTYFWEYQADYNFIDSKLCFSDRGELLKLDAKKEVKPLVSDKSDSDLTHSL